jgi:TIR domain/SIR2-like domain
MNKLELIWEQILQNLEETRVVAIVGPELLRLDLDGRTVSLETVLAERLARKLGVAEQEFGANPLHQVACRHLENHGDLQDVYSALHWVLRDGADLPLPQPLLQLAELAPIRLFVSTTVDPHLARALDRVRFLGEPRTEVLAYSPSDPQDLNPEYVRSGRPVVYHLFGRVCAHPSFAVTEEDTLEFVHSLQSEARRPRNLFDELTRNNLLVLGAGLPDWLARFLIRFAKRERLSEARGSKLDVLADATLRHDPGLVPFLEHFSIRTKVFDGNAVEFVAELHRRWTERTAATTANTAPRAFRPATVASGAGAAPTPGAIFLSYASEDRAIVESFKDQLEAAHLDVWFDRDDLAGGDRFDSAIKTRIQNCSLFVPILSRHVRTPAPRFFRKEWNYAVEVASLMPPTRAFLFPVAIDDIPPTVEEVPAEFRSVHWERVVDGRASDNLVDALRRHFRDYQRSIGGSP